MAKLRKHGPTSRNERRRAAETRQDYNNSLTPQQKLDRLPINGESKKEIRKLEAKFSLSIHDHSLELYGTCASCSKNR